METPTLSEAAVAVLRFRIKGHQMPVTERNLPALRELVDAGIMEPLPGPVTEFRFTEAGMEHREEILDAAETHRISLIPHLPEQVVLSDRARELLRTCLDGEHPDGDEFNRPAYRELVKAGIMMPVGSFTKGDECVFRFTHRGWERRFEFAKMSCEKTNST